ncbi:hypothetical protein D3C84_1213380 [compost metagenome]
MQILNWPGKQRVYQSQRFFHGDTLLTWLLRRETVANNEIWAIMLFANFVNGVYQGQREVEAFLQRAAPMVGS